MIEILFGEGEAESMKFTKSGKNSIHRVQNETLTSTADRKESDENLIEGIQWSSNEVICLAFMLEIGDIKETVESCYRKALIDLVLSQERREYPNEHKEEKEIEGFYGGELNRLKGFVDKGEELRIWYCEKPYSLCGFYFLCNWLKDYSNPIKVVKLPDQVVRGNYTVSYQNWGEVSPEEFIYFLRYEKKLLKEERWMYEIRWLEQVNDNMPLRVIINGQLMGVEEDFYDFLIWKRLTYRPIKQARLIGDILGNYQLSVWDWWYALRIDKFIACGKIRVLEDSPNKYTRTICLE